MLVKEELATLGQNYNKWKTEKDKQASSFQSKSFHIRGPSSFQLGIQNKPQVLRLCLCINFPIFFKSKFLGTSFINMIFAFTYPFVCSFFVFLESFCLSYTQFLDNRKNERKKASENLKKRARQSHAYCISITSQTIHPPLLPFLSNLFPSIIPSSIIIRNPMAFRLSYGYKLNSHFLSTLFK